MFVLINNETEPPYRDHMLVDNTKKNFAYVMFVETGLSSRFHTNFDLIGWGRGVTLI